MANIKLQAYEDSKTKIIFAINRLSTAMDAVQAQLGGGGGTAPTTPLPTTRIFTTGSGTYTTPAGALWIDVEMAGGGGGGGGGGNGAGGGTGGSTTFGSLSCGGGTGGGAAPGGAGGNPSGQVAGNVALAGGPGCGANNATGYAAGGPGGTNPFGGGGGGGGAIASGTGGSAFTGAGGGGGGSTLSGSVNGGGGGGAGAYIRAFITSPATSYSYAVGPGGGGGAAGASSGPGGNGAAGIIIVREYYTAITASPPPATVTPVTPGALSGLTLANNATTPATVLNIAMGGATSDDGATAMVLASNYTKNCNAAWAVGNGTGALDGVGGSTLAANAWYHVWLILRTDTNVTDVLLSLQGGAGSGLNPQLPPSYSEKRRIGNIKTNASNQIIAFTQLGDRFQWRVPLEDYSNATTPTSVTPLTLTVPPAIQTEAQFNIYFSVSTAAYFTIWPPDQTGMALNTPPGNITINGWGAGAVLTVYLSMRTNTLQQLNMQASGAVPGFYLTTQGWIDNRGR